MNNLEPMGKTVVAVFNKKRCVQTREIYQYNYGQVLKIEGLDLPDTITVRFAMKGEDKAISSVGSPDCVPIPDAALEQPRTLLGYIFLHEGEDDGETEFVVAIPVLPCADDTGEEPTPEEQSVIDQTIAALNTAVSKAETAISHYPCIIGNTWHVWDVQDGSYVDTGVNATGPKGDNGVSPTVEVAPITDGHRITITDAEGQHVFDVLDGEQGETGRGIASVEKTSSAGLVDTYTITYTDGATTTYTVTNGAAGFSPVASVAATPEGAVVTVTDESGTTTATIRHGEKGEDYVLTAEDRQEIADMAASEVYVPTRISEFVNDEGYINEETDPTVPAWAKAAQKPAYTAQEVGALPDSTFIPAKVSDLTNDVGYIRTETDPTVPAWAKAETKPSYTAREVGALPADTEIPTKVSDLQNDAGFISEESDPTVPAWAKEATKPTYTAQEVGALPANTAIPTKVSDLQNDSGYITGYTETDPTVPEWAKAPSKPAYTAQEIGALPDDTVIPTKVSDLTDDSGHYTKPANGIPASDLEETYVKPSDYASGTVGGTVKINGNGLGIKSSGIVGVIRGTDAEIKAGTNAVNPVVPYSQHLAVFYGLAKAAGDTTQAESENTVGTYTDEAKTAIKAMLGVTDPTVTDVQANGTSVLVNGVANIPKADASNIGLCRPGSSLSISSTGALEVRAVGAGEVKAGASYTRLLTPERQHASVFYGLAKAAGADMAQSSNEIGTYTDEAKTAIRTMIGAIGGTDYATSGTAGVVKVAVDYGIFMSNGTLRTSAPTEDQIKEGSHRYRTIKPDCQHLSTFYGLAKIAGADEKESTLPAGQYTDNAKAKIQQMLGISDMVAPSETVLIASRSYAIGDIFTINGKLYKATAAIAENEGIVLQNSDEEVTGANAVEVKLSEYMVHDVQLNGTSVLENGTANVPTATTTRFGVVQIGDGLTLNNNKIATNKAIESHIKEGTASFRPIVPSMQHISAFYGLAKAAGDTTQALSSNAVGTYTDDAKTAIRSMLGTVGSTDYADRSNAGLMKVGNGLSFASDGTVSVQPAVDADIKSGGANYTPLVPSKEHAATFYGLAKAAGDTTQAESNNAVGIYTDDAKSAIRSMIGAIGNTNYATNSTGGVVKVMADYGLYMSDGMIRTSSPTDAQIKAGTNGYRAIKPDSQHKAVFYGLAKAAGDTTQSSSNNAVGTYTDNAKAAIKSMLGISGEAQEITVSGSTPTITAIQNTRYICGAVDTLDFTPSATGICDVVFTSGSTATVLTMPSIVKWPGWFDPTALEANSTYEINVLDGVYGAVGVWS